MRFQMKQRLLSFGDDFEVKDENGNLQFYFDGHSGSIGKKVVVYGPNKEQYGVVRQHLTTFLPTYSLKVDGKPIATVWKKMMTFRPSFHVKVNGPDDLTVIGKFIEHDYRFFRNDREIASISKRWFRAKDTYGIDIEQASDNLLVLSTAVIIDLILHPKRDSTI